MVMRIVYFVFPLIIVTFDCNLPPRLYIQSQYLLSVRFLPPSQYMRDLLIYLLNAPQLEMFHSPVAPRLEIVVTISPNAF